MLLKLTMETLAAVTQVLGFPLEYRQWGKSVALDITFPIAFPTTCYSAIGMLCDNGGGKHEIAMKSPIKTGFHVNGYTYPCYFVAIGK